MFLKKIRTDQRDILLFRILDTKPVWALCCIPLALGEALRNTETLFLSTRGIALEPTTSTSSFISRQVEASTPELVHATTYNFDTSITLTSKMGPWFWGVRLDNKASKDGPQAMFTKSARCFDAFLRDDGQNNEFHVVNKAELILCLTSNGTLLMHVPPHHFPCLHCKLQTLEDVDGKADDSVEEEEMFHRYFQATLHPHKDYMLTICYGKNDGSIPDVDARLMCLRFLKAEH